MRESSKDPPDMKTSRSMRTCLSRGVPADHEARSQVRVREKSSTADKKALTGGLKRSRDRIQRCGDARTAMQETQQNKKNGRSRSHQSSRTSRLLQRQRSWRTDETERTRYLKNYCCPESEAAMKTLATVDTAREQRDRHFSRARVGEVA